MIGITRRLRTVRAQITIVATVVFAVGFIVAAFSLVRVVDREVHRSARSATETAVRDLQDQILHLHRPLSALQARPSVFWQIIDDQNRFVAGAFPKTPLLHLDAQGQPHTTKLPGTTAETVFSTPTRITVLDLDEPGWLVVASSLEGADRSVATLRHALWLATPGLILLVAIMTWLFVGRALRPVEAIRNEVEEIRASTIDRRVPVPATDDEIAKLATTMNAMLDRLQTSQQRQQEFVSDASHELRSPIASMRAELEVALAHPEGAEWQAVAQRVLGERDRLERLVDDLLQLARLEEPGATRREDVDLDDLVLAEAAHARRVPVATNGVSAGRVIGDRRSLEQVVRNLLDNAARHATTSVVTSVGQVNGHVVLQVDDDGSGVPPDERERIFERFARSDDGRGREHGGAGIGLALVQRVVTTHGGTVMCTDSPTGGARFEVRLPVV